MGETKIIINDLDHEKYHQLVEYISKVESVRLYKMGEGDGTKVYPVQITNISGSGNPPKYSEVELLVRTDIQFEEGRKRLSEAVKGLVDIISSE